MKINNNQNQSQNRKSNNFSNSFKNQQRTNQLQNQQQNSFTNQAYSKQNSQEKSFVNQAQFSDYKLQNPKQNSFNNQQFNPTPKSKQFIDYSTNTSSNFSSNPTQANEQYTNLKSAQSQNFVSNNQFSNVTSQQNQQKSLKSNQFANYTQNNPFQYSQEFNQQNTSTFNAPNYKNSFLEIQYEPSQFLDSNSNTFNTAPQKYFLVDQEEQKWKNFLKYRFFKKNQLKKVDFKNSTEPFFVPFFSGNSNLIYLEYGLGYNKINNISLHNFAKTILIGLEKIYDNALAQNEINIKESKFINRPIIFAHNLTSKTNIFKKFYRSLRHYKLKTYWVKKSQKQENIDKETLKYWLDTNMSDDVENKAILVFYFYNDPHSNKVILEIRNRLFYFLDQELYHIFYNSAIELIYQSHNKKFNKISKFEWNQNVYYDMQEQNRLKEIRNQFQISNDVAKDTKLFISTKSKWSSLDLLEQLGFTIHKSVRPFRISLFLLLFKKECDIIVNANNLEQIDFYIRNKYKYVKLNNWDILLFLIDKKQQTFNQLPDFESFSTLVNDSNSLTYQFQFRSIQTQNSNVNPSPFAQNPTFETKQPNVIDKTQQRSQNPLKFNSYFTNENQINQKQNQDYILVNSELPLGIFENFNFYNVNFLSNQDSHFFRDNQQEKINISLSQKINYSLEPIDNFSSNIFILLHLVKYLNNNKNQIYSQINDKLLSKTSNTKYWEYTMQSKLNIKALQNSLSKTPHLKLISNNLETNQYFNEVLIYEFVKNNWENTLIISYNNINYYTKISYWAKYPDKKDKKFFKKLKKQVKSKKE
ncbi:hypothetical protein [Mesomycoplasma hyorhinis]|uniref:hypothetical protein n=1 Tax=Mesomycoplasma hyorhinis TaxID=2100 RepID=UPI003DA573EF